MNDELIGRVESSRLNAQAHITDEKRKLSEQYFTPARISQLMAAMFSVRQEGSVSALDPCCGVGNLSAALASISKYRGESLEMTLVEKDPYLLESARKNFTTYENVDIVECDFFDYLRTVSGSFDRIILNPPYSKINPQSEVAKFVRSYVGHNESNLYTAFVSCCLKRLAERGELVAIIPRSFCNGPMFKNFRASILSEFCIQEIYLFESRKIFAESGVLQEMLIVKIGRSKSEIVRVSHENLAGEVAVSMIDAAKISFVADDHKFIHIPVAPGDDLLLSRMARFSRNLASIGLRASTGKVVDFRCGKWLRKKSSSKNTLLLYQDTVNSKSLVNLSKIEGVRPRFIQVCEETAPLLLPRKNYLLVRRISFKEAPSRIICSPLLMSNFQNEYLGIENHLNYIWSEKFEFNENLCLGLFAYLCSPSVDAYIRRFSGHTQINAADLNSLPIPEIKELERVGKSLELASLDMAGHIAEDVFFTTA